MTNEELIEYLAKKQHEIWAHWMKYMFSCGEFNDDGTWVMPAEKVERWYRQMRTGYYSLTEREKESDRDQARKIINNWPGKYGQSEQRGKKYSSETRCTHCRSTRCSAGSYYEYSCDECGMEFGKAVG